MIIIDPYCLIFGDSFSPSYAEKEYGINFSEKSEPGEISQKSKKKLDYGVATLIVFNNKKTTIGTEKELIDLLNDKIEYLKKCGAEKFILQFDIIWETQCNMEFDSELIQKIAKLDIPIAISCYEGDLSQYE